MRYLGGNLSQDERERKGYYTKLRALPIVNMGWRWQCACGGFNYVKYRGRYYCPDCARRMRYPDTQTVNDPEHTFRQTFNARTAT